MVNKARGDCACAMDDGWKSNRVWLKKLKMKLVALKAGGVQARLWWSNNEWATSKKISHVWFENQCVVQKGTVLVLVIR